MPTYGYECTACKEQFEVFQKMTDEALSMHEGCGGELRRLLYPVGIVFKGSGFHVNDYGRHGKKSEEKPVAKSESKSSGSSAETKTDSTPSKAETKTETAASKSD